MQEILDARTSNMALFLKLMNKQGSKLGNCITELHIGTDTFRTEEILYGWHQHFKQLATPKDNQHSMKGIESW